MTYQTQLLSQETIADNGNTNYLSNKVHPTIYKTLKTNGQPIIGESWDKNAKSFIIVRDKALAVSITKEPNYLKRLKMVIDAGIEVKNVKKGLEAIDIIYLDGNRPYIPKESTHLLARYTHRGLIDKFKEGTPDSSFDPEIYVNKFNTPLIREFDNVQRLPIGTSLIQFEKNNDIPINGSERVLHNVVNILRELKSKTTLNGKIKSKYPEFDGKIIRVVVAGHASQEGTDEYNMDLSIQRAAYMKNFLLSQGLTDDLIDVEYHGEESPIPGIDQSKESGKAINRRGEIYFEVLDNVSKGDDLTEKCIGWSLGDFDLALQYDTSIGQFNLRFNLNHQKYGIEQGTYAGSLPITNFGTRDKPRLAKNRDAVFSGNPFPIGETEAVEWLRGKMSMGNPHFREVGDHPFEDHTFMEFWSTLIPMLPRDQYGGGNSARDYEYAHVRDAISKLNMNENPPAWVKILNYEGCRNHEQYDDETERRAKVFQKVLSNISITKGRPNFAVKTTGNGGFITKQQLIVITEYLNPNIF